MESQKRKLVCIDDREQDVQESKRQKIELNEEVKHRCLKALGIAYVYFCTTFGLPTNDLHVSSQISNIIMTFFRRMKQELSGNGNLKSHDSKAFTATQSWASRDLSKRTFENLLTDVFGCLKLTMSAPKKGEKSHWWGTFMPYIAIILKYLTKIKKTVCIRVLL